MPILKSAKKALRSSLRKKQVNLRIKKNLKKALDSYKKQATEKKLRLVFSALDKAVKKKVLAKNKASRLKSQSSLLLLKSRPHKLNSKKS